MTLPRSRPARLLSLAVIALALAGTAIFLLRDEIWPPPFEAADGSRVAIYTRAAFQAAQAEGRTIVAHVEAPWCPVCRRQHPTVATLSAEPEFRDALFLSVDYDVNQGFRRMHGVKATAVLLVFKGAEEKARGLGTQDPEQMRELFRAGL